MTSDADAGTAEDEHIMGLFNEIDANKDGKVRFVHFHLRAKICPRVFEASSRRRVVSRNYFIAVQPAFSQFSKQVDFVEYLGEHGDAPAAETGAGTRDESAAAA